MSSADDDALIGFARTLASTPSISGGERAAIEATAAEMRRLGFDEVVIDSSGNCIGLLEGGPGPKLLIDGHIDSIPLHSEHRWTVDPFGGEVIDGRLYGLGICDQKASIAAALHGVMAERRESGPLPGPVAVVASVNEEDVEGAALADVVDRFAPDYAVTSEPSDTKICIGQRGRAKIEVRVLGRAVHAGHASLGLNAAEALAALIVEVRAVEHPVHPQLGKRDITCIDIASLPYPSVSTVPGEATARFDCRFVPGEDTDSLLELFRTCSARALGSWKERPTIEVDYVLAEFATWRGSKFAVPEFEAAWWTPPDSSLAVAAMVALGDVGLDPVPTYYSFCTNGSYLAGERGIPTIGFGVGLEHVAHQVDEYVTLDSLRSGARGFGALARRITAIDPADGR